MNQFEIGILLWVQEHRAAALDIFNKYVTVLNDAGILSILVVVFLLALRRYRKYGIVCAISLAIEFLLNNMCIKRIVMRTRPYVLEESLTVLTHLPSDWSFPSGHAGAGFAVAWAMFLVMPRKWGVPAVIVAALVALSRVYVGVHYPTDVIAGTVLGMIAAYIAKAAAQKMFANKKAVKALRI